MTLNIPCLLQKIGSRICGLNLKTLQVAQLINLFLANIPLNFIQYFALVYRNSCRITPVLTCSKSTMETPEQRMKSVSHAVLLGTKY